VPEPRITVGTDCRDGVARIWIRDNGIGIQPQVIDRIFEPFFTTKPVGQGTGLGLAISYNLLRNQGGHIQVTSEPNKGTTVEVFLAPHRE